ncbi:LOW QUALITY PROTEIN: hypothetical protein MXB_5361 [Myxobolus squamalis]|nr:LOW QUALITY PROTEIN: hypothetical protein MXB_5361 [Myxobolus squamalis]
MTQIPDLVRLAQSLESVENFFWILIEDSENKTNQVTKSLCINHIHLNTPTPNVLKKSTQKWYKPHRGVEQRNFGLKWLRTQNGVGVVNGSVYFMDDDNTYSIRYIENVAVWPVGHAGGCRWSGPLCDKNQMFSKWHTNWDLCLAHEN